MKLPRLIYNRVAGLLLLAAPLWVAPGLAAAQDGIQFRKPGGSSVTRAGSSLQFRSADKGATETTAPVAPARVAQAVSVAPVAAAPTMQQVAKPLSTARLSNAAPVQQVPAVNAARPVFAQPASSMVETAAYTTVDRSRQRNLEMLDYDGEELLGAPIQRQSHIDSGYCVGCNDPGCGMQEASCGCGEATCGICEPGCGFEPGCAMEPGCGVVEPGCGLEATCGVDGVGCGDVACGSSVQRGSDYWCFPVCLPRFRDLTVWGGVHGFKGPRDAPLFGGDGDGNFGFQEGVNLGGKAPLIGLMFPELSYQLGYQAVQSHLSGTSGGNTDDRAQDFVTVGFFRRVPAGLQFGAAWDYMQDDWVSDANFQQVRYELSIKSQKGREFGFTGSTHTNTSTVGNYDFQAVDQYRFFFRCSHQTADLRFWGGFTNDSEGILGADCHIPFSDRWSLESGFNYIIPDANAGTLGAQEEAWNIGMNVVWHYGRSAKQGRSNLHRPMFSIADNGVMVIDQAP